MSPSEPRDLTGSQPLLATASLREHFAEVVDDALAGLSFAPDPATAEYLIELLCERAIASSREGPALGMLLAKTERAPPAEALTGLRHVGDESLYLAGYCSESLRRSHLDRRYFAELGTGAYRRLRARLRRLRGETRLVVVYGELGEEFDRFAQVLADVREQEQLAAAELDELYAEWLRTGSEVAARRLRDAGLLLVRPPPLRQ